MTPAPHHDLPLVSPRKILGWVLNPPTVLQNISEDQSTSKDSQLEIFSLLKKNDGTCTLIKKDT